MYEKGTLLRPEKITRKINIAYLFLLVYFSIFVEINKNTMGNDMGPVIGICLALVLFVCILLLCRELTCWYLKINIRIDQQNETNRLLRKIAGEPELSKENKSKEKKNISETKAE